MQQKNFSNEKNLFINKLNVSYINKTNFGRWLHSRAFVANFDQIQYSHLKPFPGQIKAQIQQLHLNNAQRCYSYAFNVDIEEV